MLLLIMGSDWELENQKTQEELIIEKCEEVKELLIRKNRDYGNSASLQFEEYGLVSFMIRIDDKIRRLKTLVKNEGRSEVEESTIDSLSDLAGYALLALVELDKSKGEK